VICLGDAASPTAYAVRARCEGHSSAIARTNSAPTSIVLPRAREFAFPRTAVQPPLINAVRTMFATLARVWSAKCRSLRIKMCSLLNQASLNTVPHRRGHGPAAHETFARHIDGLYEGPAKAAADCEGVAREVAR
jgi:hypothetical protein